MTFAQVTTVQNSVAARIARLLRQAARAFIEWQARRTTREILRALDGRTLKDIGLDPNEIESIVYGERNERRRGYDPNWRGR